MRIACLQFAPQVGDIDNNLNRADSVLAKADPDDLENIDLLVLPELAFTGYNFKSLNHISPFLEPQGSGISALWARTTALKYNTNVLVGYPERVDVSPKWPTGPEYYNSTIIVNGDGETVANYRKSFLYVIDETWALEGKDGFFGDNVPGLGSVAMGTCMDLNPYKFEAPWHAFEFAFHILAVEANLVIINMAWVTREDGRYFSRMPEEPDMETLTYWVQRLEPLIRSESNEEVIVIFANRTGMEENLTYAGTSSVIGIKDGEVNVYGLLGRSVKDLLVIDTEKGPFAKLVQRSPETIETASQVSEVSHNKVYENGPTVPLTSRDNKERPAQARRQRKPSPTPSFPGKSTRRKAQSPPQIQIPEYYYQASASRDSLLEQSTGVETPTCPSPTPLNQRPKIDTPDFTSWKHHIDTPYPGYEPSQEPADAFGTYLTVDEPAPNASSSVSGRLTDKYFSLKSQPPLRSPMESRFPEAYPRASPVSAKAVPISLVSIQPHGIGGSAPSPAAQERSSANDKGDNSRSGTPSDHRENEVSETDEQGQNPVPPRPSSPKSRNASRTGRPTDRRPSELSRPEYSEIEKRLAALVGRPGSAMDSARSESEGPRQGRPRSRKSSIPGQIDQMATTPHPGEQKLGSVSRQDLPFMASPSILQDAIERPQSDILKKREGNSSRNGMRPGSTRPHAWGAPTGNGFVPGKGPLLSSSRSNSISWTNRDTEPHIEPDETRTLVWSELSKMVGEVFPQPESRDVSRGRPLDAGRGNITETREFSQRDGSGSQRFTSQDRGSQKPIRTILAPDVPHASPGPQDPDDEIVAEIIFHSQRSQSQMNNRGPGQSLNSGQALHASTSPPSAHKPISRQGNKGGSSPPQSYVLGSSPRMAGKGRLSGDSFGEIKVYKAPTPASINARPESDASCPSMDGASIHTQATPKCSPATPSARVFEPKTPKAMKLGFGYDEILTSTSDPASKAKFPPLESLSGDLISDGIPRAKSAAW